MGIGGISVWQLLIILLIVVMIFGTKRLRGLGSDLGAAIKGFRSSVSGDDADKEGEKGEDGDTESASEDAAGTAQLKEQENKTQ
jgi:sec-independent protein translocase protein TatA